MHQIHHAHTQEAADHCEQDSRENIHIITISSPGAFQCRPQAVIEKQHDDRKNVEAVRWHDHPGHQSPDLSVQDPVRIQCQKAQQVRTACSSHQLDDISRHITHDQYQCEIRNGIFAEFFLKFAHKVVSPFLLVIHSFFLYRDCNIHRTISKPHVQKFIEFLFF